ncbi:hypothetical protein M446_3016 [Methylobacterium sp. 4-46]|nr:hypothetical protein M446_3016 [Methylobacterium sp. 4-46]
MPQVDFIRSASGDTIVDKIYRLEDLSSDPSPLAADIGIPIETLPRENHTDGVRKPALKPSDFSMIVDMFRQDYEFLGYSIPTLDSARSHDPEHAGSGPAIAPWAEGERQDRRGERDAGRASDMRR